MSAKLLDGKALARKISSDLKTEVAALIAKTGKTPRFMNVVVGEDPSASSYARSQIRTAAAAEASPEVLPGWLGSTTTKPAVARCSAIQPN